MISLVRYAIINNVESGVTGELINTLLEVVMYFVDMFVLHIKDTSYTAQVYFQLHKKFAGCPQLQDFSDFFGQLGKLLSSSNLLSSESSPKQREEEYWCEYCGVREKKEGNEEKFLTLYCKHLIHKNSCITEYKYI